MRQVDAPELIVKIRYQLSRLPASLRDRLASRQRAVAEVAEQQLAEQIVNVGLKRLDILSSAPLPPGSDLFTNAAYRIGTGASPIDEDEL